MIRREREHVEDTELDLGLLYPQCAFDSTDEDYDEEEDD